MSDALRARIDTDEDGITLVVSTLLDTYRYRLALPIAEELYDSVKANIGPWLRERDEARYRAQAFRCDPDESAGWDERVVAIRKEGTTGSTGQWWDGHDGVIRPNPSGTVREEPYDWRERGL